MKLPSIVEVKGIRVLTTKQIADAYETTAQIISYNFNYNKKRYQEGKHFIVLSGKELKEFKASLEIHDHLKFANKIYLWTEKGALLHAKSLNTDKAWEVYDYLVDFYFRVKEKMIPEKQPKGPMVVNIPDNTDAQDMIREIKKQMEVMDTLLGSSNRYLSQDKFETIQKMINMVMTDLVPKVLAYTDLKPNMIAKHM